MDAEWLPRVIAGARGEPSFQIPVGVTVNAKRPERYRLLENLSDDSYCGRRFAVDRHSDLINQHHRPDHQAV